MRLGVKMVEVYRTSIEHPSQASLLRADILRRHPELQVDFDLEDCDNILRIAYEGELDCQVIEAAALLHGIEIALLED